MRILVTGATGVLGRRVLPLLAADGHDVVAVSRGRPEAVRRLGATPVDLDLFDEPAVRAAVTDREAVLDLATRIPPTSRMLLPWSWRANDRLRAVAAPVMAEAAGAVGARYVRESIGLLHDDGGDAWLDEDAPLAPSSHTRSALAAEAAARRVTAAGGVGVVLRFAMFYGHDSGHTRDTIDAARRGTAAVLGDPDGFVSQVHLDDAASATVAALRAPAGTYHVVEDEPVRRRDQVAVLAALVDRELRTPPAVVGRIGPARAVARSLRMSNRSLREATGWAPRYPGPAAGWQAVGAQLLETEPHQRATTPPA